MLHAWVRSQLATWGGLSNAFQALVLATVEVESSFNPNAERPEPSGVTSRGLGQIIEPTARDLGHTGPFSELLDPSINLRLTVQLLQLLTSALGFNVSDVASAYNCGLVDSRGDRYNIPTSSASGWRPRCKRSDGTYTNANHVRKIWQAFGAWKKLLGDPPPSGDVEITSTVPRRSSSPSPRPRPSPRPAAAGSVALVVSALFFVGVLIWIIVE